MNSLSLSPFIVSFKLAFWTTLLLLPVGMWFGRWLAYTQCRAKPWIESLVLLPLVLPPTVIGYYLLAIFSPDTVTGQWATQLFGQPLVFTFQGLVVASLIVNIPFIVQPMQLAYGGMPIEIREAAWVSGLSAMETWWHVELPQIWPGILAAATLVFSHTLGEFGVVLLVGGNIEGITRTVSIAIYDHVQAFEMQLAGWFSLSLVLFSLLALLLVRLTGHRSGNAQKYA